MIAARLAEWLLVLAMLAVACLWSAADRLARHGVLLGLPAPMLTGGNILTVRAAEALRRGDGAGADALARAALLRRPVDAPTLRVAGLAAIAVGDAARGDALMRLAGAAGWRDVPTQLYWGEVALAGGALDVAAERLDAIERSTLPQRPSVAGRALLHRLEALPAGRAALLRRWRQPNGWAEAYLQDLRGLTDTQLPLRAAIAVAAAPSPDRLRPLGWAFLARNRADLAVAVLRPDQRRLGWGSGEEGGPFDWSLPGAAGLDASVASDRLRVRAAGPTVIRFAYRLVRLPEGRHRLAVAAADARTAAPLLPMLECLRFDTATSMFVASDTATTIVELRGLPDLQWQLTVRPGCNIQRLSLAVAAEEARRDASLTLHTPRLISAVDAP